MKKKLDLLFVRAFGKSLYRIGMIILGLPTMLVACIAYLFTRGGEKAEYDAVRKKVVEEA